MIYRIVRTMLLAIAPLLSASATIQASELPDTPVYSLQGEPRTLPSFAGQLIVLNIFATWCSPCLKEIPSLNRMARNGRGKWVLFSVASDIETREQAQAFATAHNIRYPLFFDPGEKFSSQFPARGFPYFAIISPAGEIVHHFLGPQPWESRKMVEFLDSLTAPTPAKERHALD